MPPATPLDAATRDRRVRFVLWLEAGTDVLLIAAKLSVALVTGSTSIMADALHSGTDLANNVVALIALRLSAAPPDADHAYGHRKYEPLAVFSLAALLVVLGVQIALRALRANEADIVHDPIGLWVMCAVLVANIAFTSWEWHMARKLGSDLLQADARHTLSDVAVTISVIAGWQLASRGYVWLDTGVSLAVAALILWLAYGLFRRAIPVLTDATPRDPDELRRVARGVPGVRDATRVRSRHDGTTLHVDIAVKVDPDLSTRAAHEIADAIEQRLKSRFGAEDVLVHVEPAER